MNTYLVEAFATDLNGGSVKLYITYADTPQEAADTCRKYNEIESIISVNLRMEDWK